MVNTRLPSLPSERTVRQRLEDVDAGAAGGDSCLRWIREAT